MCKSVQSCTDNPLVCDPNADCVLMGSDYGCKCRPQHLGDGHTCEGNPCDA